MIRLCTGITPNYLQRAQSYLDSIATHNPVYTHIKPTIFWVCDYDATALGIAAKHPLGDGLLEAISVNYNRAKIQLPKWMLQSGGFVEFAPQDWKDSDVIAFTDADAVLQRPFTSEEIAFMDEIQPGDVLIGRNAPDPNQTLLDESTKIMPKVSQAVINFRFPGIDWMRCANCGFVVATLGTWKRIYAEFCKIWRAVDVSFDNPAKVQFGVCFVVQNSKEFNLRELPLTIHAHGHLSLPPGVHFTDGKWMCGEHVIAFAHAL